MNRGCGEARGSARLSEGKYCAGRRASNNEQRGRDEGTGARPGQDGLYVTIECTCPRGNQDAGAPVGQGSVAGRVTLTFPEEANASHQLVRSSRTLDFRSRL